LDARLSCDFGGVLPTEIGVAKVFDALILPPAPEMQDASASLSRPSLSTGFEIIRIECAKKLPKFLDMNQVPQKDNPA
jgi:hypothetical protein